MKAESHKLLIRKCLISTVVLAGLLWGAPASKAADSNQGKDWGFQLAPLYLWGVSMSGTMTVKGTTTPFEIKFKDAFSNLEAVFTAHFEAWYKKKWGFLFDVSYLNLGGTQDTPLPSIKVDFENVMTEVGAIYRFLSGVHDLDALAGIRYTSMDVDLDVTGLPLGKTTKVSEGKSWVDPIVGARYAYNISEKWKLAFRGDIGGFGAGADFTWNLIGLVQFKPWKYVGIVAGYRVLDVDYEDGSGADRFAYDVTMHGPLFGFNIVW